MVQSSGRGFKDGGFSVFGSSRFFRVQLVSEVIIELHSGLWGCSKFEVQGLRFEE